MLIRQRAVLWIGPDISVTEDGMGVLPYARTNCRSDDELAASTNAIGYPRLSFHPEEQLPAHCAGCDNRPPELLIATSRCRRGADEGDICPNG